MRWGLLELPDGVDIFPVIASLRNSSMVEAVEPNMVGHTSSDPSDPYFQDGHQWALKNTGQSPPSGIVGADIHVSGAWNIAQGSSDVIVAVLDSGIPMNESDGSLSHPDLQDPNRIIVGVDYTGDPVWMKDLWGHGTHVTGIVSAGTNNSTGIAGVAGGCKMLAVKVCDQYGGVTWQWFKSGVIYAVNSGAKVINYSAVLYDSSRQASDALAYANSNNVLVVASAGNDFAGPVLYPARYSPLFPNVIAVGATDQNDSWSTYSNVGSQLNIVAPGGYGGAIDANDIYSTTPNYPFNLEAQGVTENYGYLYGTSMAAPHVSGVAALMLSVNRNLTPSQIRTIIQQSADKPSGMGGLPFTNYYGYGRINAYKALKYALESYGGTLTQSFTIPSGETWNLSSGITVKFSSGVSLTSNGVLNANGTSSQPITFTTSTTGGTWNGITLSGSGANNSQLTYATINSVLTYGGSALNCLGAQNLTIANCNISNNVNYSTNGIFLYNCGNPIIHDNTISANGSFGIRLNSTNGYIWLNTISSNPSGSVDCYSYASPSFGTSGFPAYNGNNIMSGGAFGVQAASYCSPLVGSQNTSYYGYNSITATSTARISATSYSSVLAEQNWWGSRHPSSSWFAADGTSWIDYVPYLIEEPGGMEQGVPSFVVDHPTETATGSTRIPSVAESREIPDSLFQMLESAIRMRFTGNIAGATSIAKQILENSSSTPTAGLAAAELLQVYRISRDPLSVEVPEKIWKSDPTVNPAVGTALSKLLLECGRVEDAVSVLAELAQEKMPEEVRKSAMLDLIYLGIAGVTTPTGQEEVLKTLSDKYPNDPNVLQAQWLLQTMSQSPAQQQPGIQSPTKAHETINRLAIDNYPNPFNPSTTIRFALPENSFVTLKVYDVLGKEVATLVNEERSAGYHGVQFNASQLASGIYFYQIQAGTYRAVKKMILMK